MSEHPTGGGYGYNWWDTDQYYTDPADPAGGGGDPATDAATDAETIDVDQAVEDLFEDSDFIAALTQLMEDQEFGPIDFSIFSIPNAPEYMGDWDDEDWENFFFRVRVD